MAASMSVNCSNSSCTTTSGGSNSLFASTTATPRISFSDLISSVSRPEGEPPSLCLSNGPASLFPPAQDCRQFPAMPPSAHMSATALLQKAAQMGAAASGSAFLRGLGLAASTSPLAAGGCGETQWQEPTSMSAGLGLGLPYDSGCAAAGIPDMMMDSAALFGPKPAATLDFLGLGSAGGANAGGLSALINSIGGGGLEAFGSGRNSLTAKAWDGGGDDVKASSRVIL